MAIQDRKSAERNIAIMLSEVFGDSVWDDSPEDTAARILRAWEEFAPRGTLDFKFTTFPAVANQMIAVTNIAFSSLCAHHLFPYSGLAHVAYLPNALMVGLSKIPRVVTHFATQPSTQERLAHNIATFLKGELQAQGVAVVMEARHTCMSCRGVRQYGAAMVTSEMRGSFLTSGDARAEFLELIKRGNI
jgi:GTP cyclohydrolase I